MTFQQLYSITLQHAVHDPIGQYTMHISIFGYDDVSIGKIYD